MRQSGNMNGTNKTTNWTGYTHLKPSIPAHVETRRQQEGEYTRGKIHLHVFIPTRLVLNHIGVCGTVFVVSILFVATGCSVENSPEVFFLE